MGEAIGCWRAWEKVGRGWWNEEKTRRQETEVGEYGRVKGKERLELRERAWRMVKSQPEWGRLRSNEQKGRRG